MNVSKQFLLFEFSLLNLVDLFYLWDYTSYAEKKNYWLRHNFVANFAMFQFYSQKIDVIIFQRIQLP